MDASWLDNYKKFIAGFLALAAHAGTFGFFVERLEPASAAANAPPVVFQIKSGDGFRTIIHDLAAAGLIQSSFAAETFALLDGRAFAFQPGSYRLSPAMSAPEIMDAISGTSQKTVTVTIPEGANLYQIDAILSNALVIAPDDLINFHADGNVEGRLFPDTYQFYTASDVADVVKKMTDNFSAKTAGILPADPTAAEQDLILASIIEKEVPDFNDQQVVAGILLKRAAAGVPLDVDATVCYAMQVASSSADVDCGALDTKIASAYNTYLYKGFPPGPIGNPGISAIKAAVQPVRSPYWYYLSDPKTGETVFAKTLDEQHQNTIKYLDNG